MTTPQQVNQNGFERLFQRFGYIAMQDGWNDATTNMEHLQADSADPSYNNKSKSYTLVVTNSLLTTNIYSKYPLQTGPTRLPLKWKTGSYNTHPSSNNAYQLQNSN
jgi:hypothetical protein